MCQHFRNSSNNNNEKNTDLRILMLSQYIPVIIRVINGWLLSTFYVIPRGTRCYNETVVATVTKDVHFNGGRDIVSLISLVLDFDGFVCLSRT